MGEHRGGKPIPRPGSTVCASLRSGNAHGQVTGAILCGQETCRIPSPQDALCVCGNLQEKGRTPSPQEPFCVETERKNAEPRFREHLLCEPAQSKRTWPCHKSHFKRYLTGKMPHTLSGHGVNTLIEHRAFYSHRKNPFSVAKLFGDFIHTGRKLRRVQTKGKRCFLNIARFFLLQLFLRELPDLDKKVSIQYFIQRRSLRIERSVLKHGTS